VPALASADDNKLAITMRRHFELAGCTRARLTVRSNAELRLRFRSWRDAGITWSIVRGDDVVKVQRRAGHKLIATTMRYIVEAENRGATFGVPFPSLSACLLGPSKLASKQNGAGLARCRNERKILVGEAGFEPATTSTQSSCTTGLCDSPKEPDV
jgi:hypothetical protein